MKPDGQREKGPRQIRKELGSKGLNPALRELLAQYRPISKWLADPENAEAFRADPVKALKESFPKLELGEATPIAPTLPASIAGAGRAKPDPATLDFFAEVCRYLTTSEAHANAFAADPQGTVLLLGRDRPPEAVQRVVAAFVRVHRGAFSAHGVTDLSRVIDASGGEG